MPPLWSNVSKVTSLLWVLSEADRLDGRYVGWLAVEVISSLASNVSNVTSIKGSLVSVGHYWSKLNRGTRSHIGRAWNWIRCHFCLLLIFSQPVCSRRCHPCSIYSEVPKCFWSQKPQSLSWFSKVSRVQPLDHHPPPPPRILMPWNCDRIFAPHLTLRAATIWGLCRNKIMSFL